MLFLFSDVREPDAPERGAASQESWITAELTVARKSCRWGKRFLAWLAILIEETPNTLAVHHGGEART